MNKNIKRIYYKFEEPFSFIDAAKIVIYLNKKYNYQTKYYCFDSYKLEKEIKDYGDGSDNFFIRLFIEDEDKKIEINYSSISFENISVDEALEILNDCYI